MCTGLRCGLSSRKSNRTKPWYFLVNAEYHIKNRVQTVWAILLLICDRGWVRTADFRFAHPRVFDVRAPQPGRLQGQFRTLCLIQLIHTHISDNMSLNYRLLFFFLVTLFIDWQLVYHTFFWLFSESNDSSHILFAYYCITISMSIVEPALSFMIHFYEIYTNCPIENSDVNLVKLKFIINVPRLIIQLFLSMLIAYRFTLSFLMIFTLI